MEEDSIIILSDLDGQILTQGKYNFEKTFLENFPSVNVEFSEMHTSRYFHLEIACHITIKQQWIPILIKIQTSDPSNKAFKEKRYNVLET